jgi:hypothetical protein
VTSSPVLELLAAAKHVQDSTIFGSWAARHGIRCLPASPAHVSEFVRECPPGALVAALGEISQAHTDHGYADPTAGGEVARTVKAVGAMPPAPHSWPAAEKRMFERLPHDLQVYVAAREQHREKIVRRALNEAGNARRERSTATQQGTD